jgi:hypothetical protein
MDHQTLNFHSEYIIAPLLFCRRLLYVWCCAAAGAALEPVDSYDMTPVQVGAAHKHRMNRVTSCVCVCVGGVSCLLACMRLPVPIHSSQTFIWCIADVGACICMLKVGRAYGAALEPVDSYDMTPVQVGVSLS